VGGVEQALIHYQFPLLLQHFAECVGFISSFIPISDRASPPRLAQE
jgi:hypothetical protein